MGGPVPASVSGYVLAGGRSSRMGRDKALLELAGRPLVEHAVMKLRRLAAEVKVLSGNPALGAYAPVVEDLHPGCGPMSGIEAALADARYDWSLILPVDVPFLPTAFLAWWVGSVLGSEERGGRLAMFRVGEIPQPTLLMVHREVLPYLTEALARGDYKLFPVLDAAARDIAARRELLVGRVFLHLPWDENAVFPEMPWPGNGWWKLADEQQREKSRWFANLNTPEEFAEAEKSVGALDT